MPIVNLDFETRSKIDISKTSARRYAEDPSTEVICLYYQIEGGERGSWKPLEFEPFPEALRQAALNPEYTFKAFNAFFERWVWREQILKRYYLQETPEGLIFSKINCKDIPINRWRCTQARVLSHSLPRKLEKVTAILPNAVLKDKIGSLVMKKISKPRKVTKTDFATWHYKKEDFETVYAYCDTDVEAEKSLDIDTKPLTPAEQRIWEVDQAINDRGAHIDVELATAAVEMYKQLVKDVNKELYEITEGAIKTINQNAELSKWFSNNGITTSSVDKEVIALILSRDDITPKVRRVAELKQLGSKSSIAKYATALTAKNLSDDRVSGLHVFHGASTGRFAGQLVQTQNLPRGVIKTEEQMEAVVAAIKSRSVHKLSELGEPSKLLSSAIRGLFISARGHCLYVADYAAIEARILLWLAKDTRAIKMLLSGEDIYKDMASAIYNVPIDEVTPDQRQLGKQAILGLGYGMGWHKFLVTCAGYGIELTEGFAQKVVDLYRRKYNKVRALGQAYEMAFKECLTTGQTLSDGVITFKKTTNFMEIVLPSGRSIKYYQPFIKTGMTKGGFEADQIHYYTMQEGQWVVGTTYSGKLVENICQGIARDLLGEALKACEESGVYLPVLHIHDELVTEVENGKGSLDEFIELITKLPKWAEGLPLSAEGWVGTRYRK